MNLFEAEEFFKNMYADKKVELSFDKHCLRLVDVVHTDGCPNICHHGEFNKVKVDVEGLPPQYVNITSHRNIMTWKEVKELMSNHTDVSVPEANLATLSKLQNDNDPNYGLALQEHALMADLTVEKIQEKIDSYKISAEKIKTGSLFVSKAVV